MLKRRIILCLAMLGVLLHAVALVRHNGAMLDMAFAMTVADGAGGFICRSKPQKPGVAIMTPRPADPAGDMSEEPQSGKMTCPVCSGIASLHALPAPDLDFVAAQLTFETRHLVVAEAHTSGLHAVCPPSTGPPRTA